MSAMQGALSAAERSMRSVFVGNIPYEATEEQLKDIFAEVGPVVSFRLVYDRETGKPKGYGFCEYKDQEMALSAMRNLNGYELNGRALRVDNAASEKSKEELKNLQASLGGPPVESPYGPDVVPDKAPEAISKIMCTLPPEQLYDLMSQMKMCLENNPNEARNLLVQNPQLSYAILQATVIMKIVDPEVAKSMLHSPDFQPPPAGALLPTPEKNAPAPVSNAPPTIVTEVPSFPSAMPPAPVPQNMMSHIRPTQPVPPLNRPALLGERPPPMLNSERPPMVPPFTGTGGRFPQPRMATGTQQNRWSAPDQRPLGDHDLRQQMPDRDMRPPPMLTGDKDMRHLGGGDQDLRAMPGVPDTRGDFDPRYRNMPGGGQGMTRMQGPPGMQSQHGQMQGQHGMQGPPGQMQGQHGQMQGQHGQMQGQQGQMQGQQGQMQGQHGQMQGPFNGRSGPPTGGPGQDPRGAAMSGPRAPQNPRLAAVGGASPAMGGSGSPNPQSSPRPTNPLAAAAAAIAPHDSEKAALIMQVLQLSDQQIAMLPPEQRQSIMILKDQISRSQQI